jgi:GxxExxY protein
MRRSMTIIEQVTEIAIDVYRALGPGHAEAPYQKAMEVGLRLRGLKVEAQKVIEIKYAGHYVGDCNIDLLVADTVAVELKAIGSASGPPEIQQLRRYMTLLGVKDGMVINFSRAGRIISKSGAHATDKPDIEIIAA